MHSILHSRYAVTRHNCTVKISRVSLHMRQVNKRAAL